MLRLVIGNKNYSSWSMRPWVLLTQAAIPFEEVQVWLAEDDTATNIARYSPTGTVPVLLDGDLKVWDSLAICEYLADKFPEKTLWPRDAASRAIARAVSAEMHSGFAALRANMPMNIRNRYPGKGMHTEASAAVAADIARVNAIWSECVTRSGGPYLFGAFSIADAMFTPVVFRLRTYGVALNGAAAEYAQRMLGTPALIKLDQLAATEGHAQARYDARYA
jgi:glutathione S-transferase